MLAYVINKMRKIRISKDMSQMELCLRVNMSQSFLGVWPSDFHKNEHLTNIFRAIIFIECQVNSLFSLHFCKRKVFQCIHPAYIVWNCHQIPFNIDVFETSHQKLAESHYTLYNSKDRFDSCLSFWVDFLSLFCFKSGSYFLFLTFKNIQN